MLSRERCCVFFFKQKTAYEMRISDWSSDVCSPYLVSGRCLCDDVRIPAIGQPYRVGICHCLDCRKHHDALFFAAAIFPTAAATIAGAPHEYDRKSVLEGKSVAVRVDIGGRRVSKKIKQPKHNTR